ncbi:hypothetical protein ACKKBF_B09950 [Auxenochlorella protothecoides x Auxenochlorella symbiontica]
MTARCCMALAAIMGMMGLMMQPAAAFISISDGKFVDEECREFTWVGANTWRMLEAQAGLGGTDGKAVENLMQQAAALNITVLRVFATGVTPELPLQLEPGKYNQVALEALDGVMAAAADNDIRVTLVLARNWDGPDNKAAYASWNGLESPDDFFTSPAAQKGFQEHMQFMAERVNSVNGRVYKEDPAIFSWNLMNEPRYFDNNTACQSQTGTCTNAMQKWIEVSAAALKAADPNHLVAIGSEGFWGTNSPKLDQNPSNGDWAAQTGQNFVENTQAKGIDYAAIHVWPDNWNVPTSYLTEWVTQHMEDARTLGVPLVVEEFGKNVTGHTEQELAKARNPVFQAIFDLLEESIANDDVLKGAQYWMWDPLLVNERSEGWADLNQDQVLPTESTMTDIIAPAAANAAMNKPVVRGCTPKVAPTAPTAAPSDAAATSTAGRKLMMA